MNAPSRRLCLWLTSALFAVPVALSAFYFWHGAFEIFPSDEQQDKARLVAGLAFIVSVVLEGWVLFALLQSYRRR